MRNKILTLILAMCTLSFACGAYADDKRGTQNDAMIMVKHAGAFLEKNGRDKAIAAFNDQTGEFVVGDLYVVMLSMNGDGVALAHGQNPRMVGKKILDMRTADGIYPIKEFYNIVNKEGKGWFTYKWPNSLTKNVENKTSYVERFGDFVIFVGYYKP